MIENRSRRSFTPQEATTIDLLFTISSHRRAIMERIDESMRSEFSLIMEQVEHSCQYCNKKFLGKQIGAHYRNEPKCKYMKDRIWLTALPKNWKDDLKRFEEQQDQQ